MIGALSLALVAATWQVGPTRAITLPSQAAQQAMDGDTILIDAGTYAGDVATWRQSRLTIRGVGGRAHLAAAGQSAQGKATWVIQGSDTIVESIEFSGAAVPDQNGAGIRQEGANLTVRDCYFHDNENGILAGDNASSDILIEHSIFAHNGAGDGQSHNMYINRVRSLTLRASHVHDAHVGHNVKSRAATTIVEGNRITSEDGGDPSYEIEMPNGGIAIITGNVIHQGPNAGNPILVAFAQEGATNPVQGLYVAYNTFVDGRGNGTFVRNNSAVPAVVVNNVLVGGSQLLSGLGAPANNVESDPGFVSLPTLDVHLGSGSAAIGRAIDPGVAVGRSLVPSIEYLHPAGSVPRMAARDLGAFESTTVVVLPPDGGVVGLPDAAPTPDAAPPADGSAPAPDAAHADAATPAPDATTSGATDGGVLAADDAGAPSGRRPDAGIAGLIADDSRIYGSCATTTAGDGALWAIAALAAGCLVARRHRRIR